MSIKSVTFIAGGDRSGKSTVALALVRYMDRAFIIDDHTQDTKDRIKIHTESPYVYEAVIAGNAVYQLVDHDWGDAVRFYISCKVERPIKYEEEKQETPLFP